jgi:BASS family bile acid:Na+ symporter
MTAATLIVLAIKASISLLVLGFGLHAAFADALWLLRHPGLLFRSVFAMNVAMLAVAVLFAIFLPLSTPAKIALIALAASPVPPVMPIKQRKAGGTAPYAIGLLTAMSVLSILVVPLAVTLTGALLNTGTRMPVAKVAPIVLTSIIVPLLAGILIRRFWPGIAERVAPWTARIAVVLLVVAMIPILVETWPALMAQIGNGTLATLAVFSVIGLAIGHLLGGPDADDRTVLALATATRHPAVALAIASYNYPNEKAVIAVVFWHLFISAIIGIPYVAWRKRVHAGPQHLPHSV